MFQYWDYLEIEKLLALKSGFHYPGPPGADRSPREFDPEAYRAYDRDLDLLLPDGVPPDRRETLAHYSPQFSEEERSRHPCLSADEHLFITIHQSFELWFANCLTSLDLARRHLERAASLEDPGKDRRVADYLDRIEYHLRRTAEVAKLFAPQIAILRTLPGKEFARFRGFLGTASGFESYQFRMLEYHLGFTFSARQFSRESLGDRGLISFLTEYERHLEEKGLNKDAVLPAFEGPSRSEEIARIRARIRYTYGQASLKDAFFRFLERLLPGPPPNFRALDLVRVLLVEARDPPDLRSLSARPFDQIQIQSHSSVFAGAEPSDPEVAEMLRAQSERWLRELGRSGCPVGSGAVDAASVLARAPLLHLLLVALEKGRFREDLEAAAMTDPSFIDRVELRRTLTRCRDWAGLPCPPPGFDELLAEGPDAVVSAGLVPLARWAAGISSPRARVHLLQPIAAALSLPGEAAEKLLDVVPDASALYARLYFGRVHRVVILLAAEPGDVPRGDALRRIVDLLFDIEQAVAAWRSEHVATLLRVLGTRLGTGGLGTPYLAGTVTARGLPELIDAAARIG